MRDEKLKFYVLYKMPVFASHYKNFLKKSRDENKQLRYLNFLTFCGGQNPTTEQL